MLRFNYVLAGEEKAGCLGLVVFLLEKKELVAVLAGEDRAGCVFAGEEGELVA